MLDEAVQNIAAPCSWHEEPKRQQSILQSCLEFSGILSRHKELDHVSKAHIDQTLSD